MESQNIKKSRNENIEPSVKPNVKFSINYDNENEINKSISSKKQDDSSSINDQNSGKNLSPEEIKQREDELEQYEFQNKLYGLGFSSEIKSTPEFITAVKEYDPKRKSPQLLEFYNYHDEEFERHGRF